MFISIKELQGEKGVRIVFMSTEIIKALHWPHVREDPHIIWTDFNNRTNDDGKLYSKEHQPCDCMCYC